MLVASMRVILPARRLYDGAWRYVQAPSEKRRSCNPAVVTRDVPTTAVRGLFSITTVTQLSKSKHYLYVLFFHNLNQVASHFTQVILAQANYVGKLPVPYTKRVATARQFTLT